jgi:RNA polymerase sigma factor (sigma-70 family)
MTARDPGSEGVNPVDRLGREINPAVLKVAEQLRKRLFGYGERTLGDPAVVANLLEESSAAVSRVLRRSREGSTKIRDLHAYLFRVFIRRINRVLRQQTKLKDWDLASSVDYRESLEEKLILDEFLRMCDPVTRQMLYRRIEGFSWKEIGRLYGVSAHTAESRCSQAIQRVRRKLGYRD